MRKGGMKGGWVGEGGVSAFLPFGMRSSFLSPSSCVCFAPPLLQISSKSRSVSQSEWIPPDLGHSSPSHLSRPLSPPPCNTQLSTTHIPPLSVPYWITPHQARPGLVAVSPWRPVGSLMIGRGWRLTPGLVEHWEGGSLFLWVGCRGIEEDLRARCDPYSNTGFITRHGFAPRSTICAWILSDSRASNMHEDLPLCTWRLEHSFNPIKNPLQRRYYTFKLIVFIPLFLVFWIFLPKNNICNPITCSEIQ